MWVALHTIRMPQPHWRYTAKITSIYLFKEALFKHNRNYL